MNSDLRQYIVVTACYWAFTITDGALRMLVVLYFHNLGYSPLEVAMLFILYEFFGVVTNLFGGWMAAHFGLNLTLKAGLALQIVSLILLMLPPSLLTVGYVMMVQALSGIAKDLNKMSAKSAIKLLVPEDAQGQLYKWVALLTGSKNTLKGVGFFVGGLLLSTVGFQWAVGGMASVLLMALLASVTALDNKLGKSTFKPKFNELFSKSAAINRLSAARLFLFGARDVWFVVALPVYLQSVLNWGHMEVGGFLALWVIGYGVVQAFAPMITGGKDGSAPDGRLAVKWAGYLALLPAGIAAALHLGIEPNAVLIVGLLVFGIIFAINSSLHSYLIVSYADAEGVSLDVGFYYMANAAGRLLGTVLSGIVFQFYGLIACLLFSSVFILIAWAVSIKLPQKDI